MKLSFLSSIRQFAITHLGVVQDSDNDMTALMQRNGMLEPAESDGAESDDCYQDSGWESSLDEDYRYEFDDGDFDFDFDPDAEISDTASTDAYINRQISKIPQYGDGARWRLADYLNMFDDLSRDGSLTNEQREAVDNFVAGYQPDRTESDECCDDFEMDFPECQYVAGGLDLETAQKLGDAYRAGKFIPQIGDEAADRISNRLNQMQSQRFPLRK